MKKMTKAIVTGVVGATSLFCMCTVNAESLPEVTMEQIVNANVRENFLKDGSSYQTEISYQGAFTERAYSDSELDSLTWITEDGETTQLTVGNVGIGIYEGEYEFYLIADDSWVENNQAVFINCLDKAATEKESIEECIQEGDNLIITTSLSTEDTKEVVEGYGVEYREGDIQKVVYTVDAKTYVLAEEASSLIRADGTVEDLGGIKVTFDPERPESADEMYRFLTESESKHTVTIVLDPDTEEEKTYSATLPTGTPVYEILPEGYEMIYADKECTEALETGIDQNEDVVVYSIPAK